MDRTAKRNYDELAADQATTPAPADKKVRKASRARPEQGYDLSSRRPKARGYANRNTENRNAQHLLRIKELSEQLERSREKLSELPTLRAWREMQYDCLRVKRENAAIKKTLSAMNKQDQGTPAVSTHGMIPGSARNPYTASNRLPSDCDTAAQTMTLPQWAQPTTIPLGKKVEQRPSPSGDFYMQSSCDRQLLGDFQRTLHADDSNFDEMTWR